MKILAFDIGGTALKYGIVDENFNISDIHEIPSDAEKGGAGLVAKLKEIFESYDGIDRVGISTAGQINPNDAFVIHALENFPGFSGTSFKEIFTDGYGVPVAAGNDVNCAAMGEAQFGAARGLDNFLCLTYGTGVGGAIYMDGRVIIGDTCSAGEFGHIRTHVGGNKCPCGGYGCYEAYASTTALVRRCSPILGHETNGREIFEPSVFSNPEIKFQIDEWIDEIVIGLVSLCNIFNPPAIVVGGGIMNEEYVRNEVDRKLHEILMPNFRKVKLLKAQLGNKAGMLGAAYNVSVL
jgi:predicted NBD/HSP70 family sugar kinase